MAFRAADRQSEALRLPKVEAGAEEGTWSPQSDVRLWALPQAEAGGEGADLATVASVISGNSALRPGSMPVHGPTVTVSGGTVHSWGTREAAVRTPPVHPESVMFSTVLRNAAAVVRIPNTRPVKVAALRAAVTGARAGQGGGLLTLRGGRVRPGPSILANIPLTRRRLSEPEEDFDRARALLATVGGVPEPDVMLIGVFPQVPLAAVERLALADEGAGLRIWLKPEALGPRRTGGPKLVTVVFGRQRSTGKMLQAVLTAAPRAER